MASRVTKEEDQVARVAHELREGHWFANARKRSQRRKSPWNLLLPLLGLPLWVVFVAFLVWLASVTHTVFRPNQSHAFFALGNPANLGDILVLLPAFVVAVAPALVLSNFLVNLIPLARRAMGVEDRDFPDTGYESSQRALIKVGFWLAAICLPLILIGAALK